MSMNNRRICCGVVYLRWIVRGGTTILGILHMREAESKEKIEDEGVAIHIEEIRR